MPVIKEPWRARIKYAGYAISNTPGHLFRPLEDYDLWFAWSGKGEMWDGRRTWPAVPGSLFCLRYGRTYETHFDPEHPLGHSYIHFDFLGARGQVIHPPERHLPPFAVRLKEVEFTCLAMRRIADLFRAKNPLKLQEAHCYLRGLLASLRAPETVEDLSSSWQEHHRRIADVIQTVRTNPALSFDLAEIASSAFYGADYFTRVFREIQGVSPKEFFIAVRMERARELLTETPMTGKAIAKALGYADLYFFSRQFKQWHGLSPERWRRQKIS